MIILPVPDQWRPLFEKHNPRSWKAERMWTGKRPLSTSCNDYLRYEYAATGAVPPLLNLPFELLERILDEVALNSIGGVRPFARASRLCRALSRPYSFEIPRVTFNELYAGCNQPSCTPVSLRETNEFKTLEIIRPYYTYDGLPSSTALEALRPIESVLGNQNCYTHVRYLIDHDPSRICSGEALERIHHCCPQISRLTLALFNIREFCFDNGSPGYRSPQAISLIAIISHFTRLQHLELRFTIDKPNLHLLYPTTGTQLAEDIFTRIQDGKHGLPLSRLDIVFTTATSNLFGRCYRTVPISRSPATLSVTMSCFTIPSSSTTIEESKTPHPQRTTSQHCSHPIFSTILNRKAYADRLLGPHDTARGYHSPSRRCCTPVGWEWEAGPRTWKYVHSEWPHPSRGRLLCAQVRTLPAIWAWYAMRGSTRRRLVRRVAPSCFGSGRRGVEDEV